MLELERLEYLEPPWEKVRDLAKRCEVSLHLMTLLWNRGLREEKEIRSFLFSSLASLHSPWLLPDMERAVSVIRQAVREGVPILVHGDYDADGVCSTALLVLALKKMGAKVEYFVPDRFVDGYGVATRALEKFYEKYGSKGLVITIDCGSSALEAIDWANEHELSMVILDHHQTLPDPLKVKAHVNPHREDSNYPFPEICATMIGYKVVQALEEKGEKVRARDYLDLATVATIADVMPLLNENRALVKEGILQMQCRPRKSLAPLLRRWPSRRPLMSSDVAFQVAPRLNAAGRMEHAKVAVELLLSQETEEIKAKVQLLDRLNSQRKRADQAIFKEVLERLDEDPVKRDLPVVVEAGQDWHVGIVGITASKLVRELGKPAFVMTIEGDVARGSARSGENIHLIRWMRSCDELFLKYGGHACAGGYSLPLENVDRLREALSQSYQDFVEGEQTVRVDMPLAFHKWGRNYLEDLRLLEPTGEANPPAQYWVKQAKLEALEKLGRTSEHYKCLLKQGKTSHPAMAFYQEQNVSQLDSDRYLYDVVAEVDLASSRATALQFRIRDFVALDSQLKEQEVLLNWSKEQVLVDLRHLSCKEKALEEASHVIGMEQEREIHYSWDSWSGERGEDWLLLSPPRSLAELTQFLSHPWNRVMFAFSHEQWDRSWEGLRLGLCGPQLFERCYRLLLRGQSRIEGGLSVEECPSVLRSSLKLEQWESFYQICEELKLLKEGRLIPCSNFPSWRKSPTLSSHVGRKKDFFEIRRKFEEHPDLNWVLELKEISTDELSITVLNS